MYFNCAVLKNMIVCSVCVCVEKRRACVEKRRVCVLSRYRRSDPEPKSCRDMCEGIVQLCDPATTSRGRCTIVFNVSDRDVLQKAFRLLPHHKDAWTTGALRVPCRRLSQTPFSPHASNHAYVSSLLPPSIRPRPYSSCAPRGAAEAHGRRHTRPGTS